MSDDSSGSGESTRDHRGRFIRGVSGNPAGRPRTPASRVAEDDLFLAGQTLVDITLNGKKTRRTKREVLVSKMLQIAASGDGPMLRHLDRKFDEIDKIRAEARATLQSLELKYFREGADEMPLEVELLITSLRSYLSCEWLRPYAKPMRKPRRKP
jgi:outer membrane usher protein FimD/PapC